jgi:hypothetical protein
MVTALAGPGPRVVSDRVASGQSRAFAVGKIKAAIVDHGRAGASRHYVAASRGQDVVLTW